jgi:hypothetical protein
MLSLVPLTGLTGIGFLVQESCGKNEEKKKQRQKWRIDSPYCCGDISSK